MGLKGKGGKVGRRGGLMMGTSGAVSNKVKRDKHLKHLVVEERPKRSRDESPEQARKRPRHAQ